jgi:hypothetical protein
MEFFRVRSFQMTRRLIFVVIWVLLFVVTAMIVGTTSRSENIGGAALKLRFPSRNLIGVNVEMPGQLGYRPIALDGGQSHLRLEGR